MDNVENVENTSKAVGLCDDLINDCYEGRVSSPVELSSRVAEMKAAIVEELDHFREAAKMVGNFSAMRKALVIAKSNFDAIGANACEGDLNLDAVEVICARISAIIEAALSAPRRNCDRFVDELDAQLAFLNEKWLISVDRESMLERDKLENWTDEMRLRFARWLLDPVE